MFSPAGGFESRGGAGFVDALVPLLHGLLGGPAWRWRRRLAAGGAAAPGRPPTVLITALAEGPPTAWCTATGRRPTSERTTTMVAPYYARLRRGAREASPLADLSWYLAFERWALLPASKDDTLAAFRAAGTPRLDRRLVGARRWARATRLHASVRVGEGAGRPRPRAGLVGRTGARGGGLAWLCMIEGVHRGLNRPHADRVDSSVGVSARILLSWCGQSCALCRTRLERRADVPTDPSCWTRRRRRGELLVGEDGFDSDCSPNA